MNTSTGGQGNPFAATGIMSTEFFKLTQKVLAPMPAEKRYEYTLDSNAGSGCSSHDLFGFFLNLLHANNYE
jgi:hypothetical protein